MAGESDRSRYTGTAVEFKELIRPAVTTANFLIYDSSPKVTKTKVIIPQIQDAHRLLAQLYLGAKNLCFVWSVVKEGLTLLHTECGGWNLKPAEREEWIETMTNRIMNLCRVVGQGDNKSPKPKWARELPWNAEPQPASAPPAAASAAKPAEATSTDKGFIFGFDFDLVQAWRAPSSKPDHREPSTSVEVDGEPSDPPLATWADGFSRKVMNLTNESFATMAGKRQSAKASLDVKFDEPHTVSKNRVIVKSRADRSLLMVLFEQGKQRLQVRVDSFPDEAAAADFMVGIAKAFVKDEIAIADLKSERDTRLAALGISARSRAGPAMKRPAAAPKVDTADECEEAEEAEEAKSAESADPDEPEESPESETDNDEELPVPMKRPAAADLAQGSRPSSRPRIAAPGFDEMDLGIPLMYEEMN